VLHVGKGLKEGIYGEIADGHHKKREASLGKVKVHSRVKKWNFPRGSAITGTRRKSGPV